MNAPQDHVFEPDTAAALCQASADAYQHSTITHATTDTAISIIHDPLSIETVVAFRGTADLRNWLTDLDCELIRVRNFRVHRGFYEAMQAVEEELDARLSAARAARLWVTGHSLGGALAKLWALWAAGRGHEIAGVYTFGQPRVGDAAFAACYDSALRARSFRVVHADDIVPRIPWLLARYRHAGHEAFFPTVGRDSVEPCFNSRLGFDRVSPYLMDLGWPRKFLRGLPAAARALRHGKLAFLDDHHISRYQALFPAPRAEAGVSYIFQS